MTAPISREQLRVGVPAGTVYQALEHGKIVSPHGIELLDMYNEKSIPVRIRLEEKGAPSVHNGSDDDNPVQVGLPYDLASVIVAANTLKAAYNAHVALALVQSDAGIHKVADTTNVITSDDAIDAATSYTLLNELKTDLNAHAQNSTYHVGPLTSAPITSADASTLATSITLAFELINDFNAHMESFTPVYGFGIGVKDVPMTTLLTTAGGSAAGPYNPGTTVALAALGQVVAGSVRLVIWDDVGGAQVVAADQGNGTLTGTGVAQGLINYETGEIHITFDNAIANGAVLYGTYQSKENLAAYGRIQTRVNPSKEVLRLAGYGVGGSSLLQVGISRNWAVYNYQDDGAIG
jgi:hypothetical protein